MQIAETQILMKLVWRTIIYIGHVIFVQENLDVFQEGP